MTCVIGGRVGTTALLTSGCILPENLTFNGWQPVCPVSFVPNDGAPVRLYRSVYNLFVGRIQSSFSITEGMWSIRRRGAGPVPVRCLPGVINKVQTCARLNTPTHWVSRTKNALHDCTLIQVCAMSICCCAADGFGSCRSVSFSGFPLHSHPSPLLKLKP